MLTQYVLYTIIGDRPQLHQLMCWKVSGHHFKIIQQVGVNWKKLAFALRFDYGVIKIIEGDARHMAEESCQEMFHRWLNEEACQPIMWARLIEALKDAEQGKLAKQLEQLLT